MTAKTIATLKLRKVIDSCTTPQHAYCALNMYNNFEKLYGHDKRIYFWYNEIIDKMI